jgi:hypothetical protein
LQLPNNKNGAGGKRKKVMAELLPTEIPFFYSLASLSPIKPRGHTTAAVIYKREKYLSEKISAVL